MFDRSPLTIQVCDLLRSTNGEISYQRISSETGKPLDELRPTLLNARKYLERDEGIVFVAVYGQGLRRLNDAEKVESSKTFIRRIRRTAVRGVTRLDAVSEFTALSNEDQMVATIQRTIFQAVQRETGEQKK